MSVKFITGSSKLTYEISDEIYTKEAWSQLLQDWLERLIKQNEKLKEEANPRNFLVAKEAAIFALGICKKCDLSSEIRFLALDLYNRFCGLHIASLTQQLNVEYSGKIDEEYMQRVQEKVALQAPLRVLTCLRLASKLICHEKVMTGHSVQKLLKEVGQQYDIKSINKSEMRVLETINFCCTSGSSPIEFIGVLIACVKKEAQNHESTPNTFFINQIKRIQETSLLLLDAINLQPDVVYNELLYRVTGSRKLDQQHSDSFARVRSDRLLLTSSIVMASGWIVGGDRLGQMVLKVVSEASCVPEEDIEVFASCIIKLVIGRSMASETTFSS